MATHRWGLSLLPALVLAGCGGGASDWPVSHDLAAGFAGADVHSETRSVVFGTAAGRRHLVSGWTEDRWDKRRKKTYVIAKGQESMLHVELIEPRPLVLQLYGRPMDPESGVTIDVEVQVNGYPVQTLDLANRPRRYKVPVKEGVLRAGANEILLRYHRSDSAAPAYPVGWYRLDLLFDDGLQVPWPAPIGSGDSLMIPFGTRLDYTLRLPVESALTIDRVRHLGESGGTLSMVVAEDGEPSIESTLTTKSAERIEHDLSSDRERIVRLTLRADHPEASISGKAGVILESVAIRSPARSSQEAAIEQAATQDARPAGERPNILLYVVDTLRADHLGVYGYPKPVSPELDRFAERATVFDNAIANSSWTRAAMASMFTGLWPLKHAANGRKDILDPEAVTMAELLAEAGYQTMAKVRNWNVFPVFGFRQGFEEFRRVREGKADKLSRQVEEWLESEWDERPFFLWVHTVDPHEPYRPPAETRDLFMAEDQEDWQLDKHPGFKRTATMTGEEKASVSRYLRSLYDAEIAFNDRGFGDLIGILEDRDLLDSTVVIFVSDHGEEFLDHGGWGHGRNLFAENMNVPLIIRFPDRGQGVRVGQVVQQIDLLPTLLDYLDLPIPGHIEGSSFLGLLDSESPAGSVESRPAFSFLHLDGAPTRSVVDGDWKLIQRLGPTGGITWTGLFNRRTDAGERVNLALDHPIRVRFMTTMLDAKMIEGSLLTTEEAVLDEETTKALKALGYLQ